MFKYSQFRRCNLNQGMYFTFQSLLLYVNIVFHHLYFSLDFQFLFWRWTKQVMLGLFSSSTQSFFKSLSGDQNFTGQRQYLSLFCCCSRLFGVFHIFSFYFVSYSIFWIFLVFKNSFHFTLLVAYFLNRLSPKHWWWIEPNYSKLFHTTM